MAWPRGVLLHGPPGCGKTAAVRAVAAELGVPVHELPASAVFGAFTGESERRLRDAFAAASAAAADAGRPAVLLLDDAGSELLGYHLVLCTPRFPNTKMLYECGFS